MKRWFLPFLLLMNLKGVGVEVQKPASPVHPEVVTLRHAPLFANRIGPFELFKTTKARVQEVLGKQAIRPRHGQCCGESICYVDVVGRLYVEFEFGPSGGFEQLTGYRLGRSRELLSRVAECGRHAALAEVVNRGPVRLGDSVANLTAALGLDGTVHDGTYRFLYEERVKFTEADREAYRRQGIKIPPEEQFWDLVYRLDVVVINGLVEDFAVLRTETT